MSGYRRATDTQGCSNKTRIKFSKILEDGLSSGMKFMWTLIIIGVIVLLVAGMNLLRQNKEEDLNEELSQIVETTDTKSWDMPFLTGLRVKTQDLTSVSSLDGALSRFRNILMQDG